MLLQLKEELEACGELAGQELLPGRCCCGQGSARKEAATTASVTLQLVRLPVAGDGSTLPYEPKADGATWRKYGDKSAQVGDSAVYASSAARGRLYYKCTRCAKDGGEPRAAARKMVQPVHCAPGLFLLRYEGTHSHAVPGMAGQSEVLARHVEGVLWEMTMERNSEGELPHSAEAVEQSLQVRQELLGCQLEEVRGYVRAVLGGLTAARKGKAPRIGDATSVHGL